ncbi:hypothetical protein KDW_38640 [Dictyobacter vulcani]|uniref:Uncharacterized protein n=2 Tax=Dictyobacter vulcani TaxID=2607529 RepID=A0A5J4KRH4_9CHLR|nr:hypothetical protein KDW_38640 [Dictyobacter vulcani]
MKHVLILTRSQDSHTPPVVEGLQHRGVRVSILHTADFPEAALLNAQIGHGGWTGSLTYQDQHIPLESLTSIWRRRPEKYKASGNYTAGEKAFIEEEADRALIGMLESLVLQETFWVSRTHSVRRADLKALQLSAAHHVGIRVPQTLITNDPEAVADFYEHCQGNVVLKAVAQGTIKDEEEQIERFIYTSQVAKDHLADLAGVRITAHFLQEYIPKQIELRVVVIGRQIFAAEIHSQHSERAKIDFRRGYSDLQYHIHALPNEITANIFKLVNYFDLQFSSMDLILTPQGEYVFLDLNPNGQYYWLQLRLPELHLAEAMADVLASPKEYRL